MVKKGKHRKRAFRRILNEVASANAVKLVDKARIANKLAKSLSGKPRNNAYAVKTKAVFALASSFPEAVRIESDFSTPGFLLVKAPALRFALHAPYPFSKVA